MQNPLLSSNTITAIDTILNEEIVVTRLNIGKYYKKIYCLCPFSSIDINIINKINIEEDEYNEIISKMILYETKINIVKNPLHYGNIIYCNKNHIIKANHFNYDLDEMVLILPFFNISFLNLTQYIDTIMGCNNMDKLYNMHVMFNYFGEKNKETNKMALTSIINNLSESNYWKYEYNCRCNLTKLFDKRNFNFSIIKKSLNESINKVLDSLDNINIRENYLEEIFKSKKYTDPSSVICTKGYRLYNVVKNCKYNNTDINNLIFDSVETIYQKKLLFTQLLLSKEYCHLVINNINTMQLMNHFIKNNILVFENIFGYAWTRFYFEECICKFNMNSDDYYIFDADTASILPVFHFDYNEPQKNPYMPILVSQHSLNPSTNIGGVIRSKKNNSNRVICNTLEFIHRMNIFITNDMNKNIFNGINFTKYKMAITGSIMTACLQLNHPLLELYDTPGITMNNLYNRFFNEYYCNADVDIMIKTYDMIEYIDICKEFHSHISSNILSMYDYSEPQHIVMKINKSINIFITSNYINDIIEHVPTLTYDFIVSNLSNMKIIILFEKAIKELHTKETNKVLEGYDDDKIIIMKSKYKEYFDFNIMDVTIRLYDKKVNGTMINYKSMSEYTEEEIDKILETSLEDIIIINNVNNTNDIGMSISFKTRISAYQLDHDFELFPIKKNDFMNTVGQFHMPCVRAYYNGTKVYMTPSCISAHMTFMNIDYKYFAGSRDPIEIINKYRMRGFGTWLNQNEIKTFIKYTGSVPFWNNLYNINLKSKNIGDCLGPLQINHKLFFPRQFNMEYYNDSKFRPIPFDDPYIIPKVINNMNSSDYYKEYYEYDTTLIKKNNYIDKETGYMIPLNDNILNDIFFSI